MTEIIFNQLQIDTIKGQIFSRYVIENLKDQQGRKGMWRGGSVGGSEGTSVRRQRLEKTPRRWTYRCHCGIAIADRVMRSRFPSCDPFADRHGVCPRNFHPELSGRTTTRRRRRRRRRPGGVDGMEEQHHLDSTSSS